MEDLPLGLDKWLVAMWLIGNGKNGIRSYEVAKDLGITQKSAWFMRHRIRLGLQAKGGGKMSGGVEVDETFGGGKARDMHVRVRKAKGVGRGGSGKTVVMGVLANVRKGTKVYTDEHLSYIGLQGDFAHRVINRAEEYARGSVHTNGMKNYGSLVKRGLNGTYASAEPFHLFCYLDEQSFRFNLRKEGKRVRPDGERMNILAGQIAGKRLTY